MGAGHGRVGPRPRPPAFVPFPAKLNPPERAGTLVTRDRLLSDLVGFPGRQVVLSAPAGYGKSTLAAQWIARDPRPAAWLSLDPADNDPHVLLTYLGLALDRVEPVDDDVHQRLTAEGELPDLLQCLAALLDTRAVPFVLVLDDVHVLDGTSLGDVVGTLAHHIPTGSTLVLSTRGAAPFPTSRGALRGDVRVVDRAALAMTRAEAEDLLQAGGIDAAPEAAAALEDLAEGWPTGLYLATLALRDVDDPVAAAHQLSGRHRPIADFFAEEVLPALAPDDVEFLLATSVLDRCCGELCDVALDRVGSSAVLERLARTNQLVIPLDDTGDWYRYHHLFAQMLRAEFRRRDPAAAALVARRASVWFEQRFEPDPAVTLSLWTGDHPRVVDLVSRFAPILQTDRRHATVVRWLDAFTSDEIASEPALALTAAWNALLVGDAAGVHRFAGVMDQLDDTALLPDGTPPHAAAELLRALTTSRGLTDVRDHAAFAFAQHAANSVYRSLAALLGGNSRLLLGDLDGAIAALGHACALGRRQFQATRAQGLAGLARHDAMHGDWSAARDTVDEALAVVDEHWLSGRPAMGIVYSVASLVHARTGRSDQADEERAHARNLLGRLDDVMPFFTTVAMIELAESALGTGHVDDATTLLAEAERRLRRLRDTGFLPFALARVGTAVAAASGRPAADLVEPLSPAELRVLAFLPTHLSFGEIGEELFVSRNTVKSHAMAIYRKLGVTSRSTAVKEAVRLGIVEA